jgi:hypothetical protein
MDRMDRMDWIDLECLIPHPIMVCDFLSAVDMVMLLHCHKGMVDWLDRPECWRLLYERFLPPSRRVYVTPLCQLVHRGPILVSCLYDIHCDMDEVHPRYASYTGARQFGLPCCNLSHYDVEGDHRRIRHVRCPGAWRKRDGRWVGDYKRLVVELLADMHATRMVSHRARIHIPPWNASRHYQAILLYNRELLIHYGHGVKCVYKVFHEFRPRPFESSDYRRMLHLRELREIVYFEAMYTREMHECLQDRFRTHSDSRIRPFHRKRLAHWLRIDPALVAGPG